MKILAKKRYHNYFILNVFIQIVSAIQINFEVQNGFGFSKLFNQYSIYLSIYSSSPLASSLDLFHITTSLLTSLSIFNVFILNMLTSSRILKFFYNFTSLVSILINFSFSCYCFLTAIFNYCLLRNWFSHSSHASAHSEATWLERRESTSSETTSKSSSKEIIFIIKSSHHTKLCKWISSFLCLSVTSFLLVTKHSHLTKSTTKSSTKEVIIIIIEKVCKWVSSSKEIFEYLLSTMHIEMSKICMLEMMTTSAKTTTLTCMSSVDNIFSSICIVIRPLFRVT